MLKRILSGVKTLLLKSPSQANYKFILKDWIRLYDLEYASSVLETKRFSVNTEPVLMAMPAGKRIIVFAPHPDDEVYGAGGVLLKLLEAGADIHIIYFADSIGEQDQAEKIREEAREQCKAWGMTPHFLGFQPKHIPLNDRHMLSRIRTLVDMVQPSQIFTTFLLDDHDDHRRVNQVLLKLQEDGIKCRPEIWAFQVYTTLPLNVIVDITEQIEQKLEGVRNYKSVSGTRDWANYIRGMAAINARFLVTRRTVFAEVYFVVPFLEYMQLCRMYFSNPPSKIYYSEYYTTGKA